MGDPRIVVVEDADELGRVGADLVTETIAAVPDAGVVAATGRSPIGLYEELSRRRQAGLLDPAGITAFQLDEYLGLEPNDRRSLWGWMRRIFTEPLGVAEDRVVPLPIAGDLAEACAAFDRALTARGGLDLAILGLGLNGHLGFNEPPSDPDAPTRGVDLSPSSIAASAGYWHVDLDVPARAVTMGMSALLSSRTVVLLVAGENKRAIAHRALEGPVGPEVPASFLREAPGEVTVVIERAAWGTG